eukprot:3477818-Rhodomonas_salina.1
MRGVIEDHHLGGPRPATCASASGPCPTATLGPTLQAEGREGGRHWGWPMEVRSERGRHVLCCGERMA